jgi:hypothetical protein
MEGRLLKEGRKGGRKEGRKVGEGKKKERLWKRRRKDGRRLK